MFNLFKYIMYNLKSTNSNVHEQDHRQTTKCHAHEMISQFVTAIYPGSLVTKHLKVLKLLIGLQFGCLPCVITLLC